MGEKDGTQVLFAWETPEASIGLLLNCIIYSGFSISMQSIISGR